MKWTILTVSIGLLIGVSSLAFAVQAQESAAYHLGVQDRVRVYVHEWPSLTGEFVVGANGALNLPLIGAVPARGRDIAELTTDISQRLQEKAQLGKTPETIVDIAQYRPFYILGGVERPGSYEYRPDMLVVNAIAIAGGLYRVDWSTERDTIAARGQARIAAVQLSQLRAKELRLKAEFDGVESFPQSPADWSIAELEFVEHERRLFSARLEHYRNQYEAHGETIVLLNGEIESLEGQITSAHKQENSVKRELEDVRGLVARSLAPAPRILPIERTLAQIEREQKEIATAIMRARQQINTVKIQREALKDERRSSALTELQTLEAQRKELEQQISTAADVLGSTSSPPLDKRKATSAEGAATFSIIRKLNGVATALPAGETTALEPGDILKVYRPQDLRPTFESSDVKREDNSAAASAVQAR